ncbi:2'-5' RNA ligase family protein [Candidatus Poriferisodalis sp.]|uniref:2'-5' RNA ligase family protein n=1 Tax=Candidatus Poriferisodalis sp. TaxID=3101277 RepID=UPI003B02CEE6
MPRLFVAVWPPESVIDHLASLPRPPAPGVSWTKPARLHITLRFLGECDLDEAIGTLQAGVCHRAGITLGPEPERLGRGVLMLPAAGADELAESVIDTTRYIGDAPPDHPFVGHLTIARFRKRQPSVDWPRLGERFEVNEISLVEAAPWGEYLDVASFPLH